MSEAFLIMFREGFEGALVVAIVFGYLRKIGRRDLTPSLWAGVAAGVILAIAVGVSVQVTVGSLEGEARTLVFAGISIAAAGVLTWMIFWMRRQGGAVKGELEEKVDTAVTAGTGGRGVLLVAFAAVLREGIEAALFLIAASISMDATEVVVGGIGGLLAAAGLGVLVYFGGRRIPMRTFFRVTGVLLILFAAGLLSKAVFLLQAGGDLGTLRDAAFDLTGIHWLTTQTESGRLLGGMLGWDPRPSIEQVAVWLLYVLPVTTLFLMDAPAPRPSVPQAA